jgi:hypothetical protein
LGPYLEASSPRLYVALVRGVCTACTFSS